MQEITFKKISVGILLCSGRAPTAREPNMALFKTVFKTFQDYIARRQVLADSQRSISEVSVKSENFAVSCDAKIQLYGSHGNEF